MKDKREVYWNFPFLALIFLIICFAKLIVSKLENSSESQLLLIVNLVVRLLGFSFSLFITFSLFYYSKKILDARCIVCGGEIKNKKRKVFIFLTTLPWKKRKVGFICLDCKRTR
jgi:hypothetical protein